MAEFDELADVVVILPVELALGGLDLIPEDVEAEGVEAHGAGFFDAVWPELKWDAGGVNFAGDDFNGVAVDGKLVVAGDELVLFVVAGIRGGLRDDNVRASRQCEDASEEESSERSVRRGCSH